MEPRARGRAEVGRAARADDRRVPPASDGTSGDSPDGAEDAHAEGSGGGGHRADAPRGDHPRHREEVRPHAGRSQSRSRTRGKTDVITVREPPPREWPTLNESPANTAKPGAAWLMPNCSPPSTANLGLSV